MKRLLNLIAVIILGIWAILNLLAQDQTSPKDPKEWHRPVEITRYDKGEGYTFFSDGFIKPVGLALTEDGVLHLFYQARAHSPTYLTYYEFFHTYSRDHGKTWGPAMKLDSFLGCIQAAGNEVLLAGGIHDNLTFRRITEKRVGLSVQIPGVGFRPKQMIVEGDKIFLIVRDRDDIFFIKSLDGGKTWSDLIKVCESGDRVTLIGFFSTGDKLHAIRSIEKEGKAKVVYMNSEDEGKTWQESDLKLEGIEEEKTPVSFRAIVQNRTVFLVFLGESRELTKRDGKPVHKEAYYLTISKDQGKTWAKVMKITPDFLSGFIASLEFSFGMSGPHGLLAFGDGDEMHIYRSEDGGITWKAEPDATKGIKREIDYVSAILDPGSGDIYLAFGNHSWKDQSTHFYLLFRKYGPKPATAPVVASPEFEKEIKKLIEELGNDNHRVREEATDKLMVMGEKIIPYLEEALKHPDPEIQYRIQLIITGLIPEWWDNTK